MNCYVKLAYGWEYIEQSSHSYMTNALDTTIFALDESNNKMAQLISEGIKLDYLEKTYGDNWIKFKETLEKNYAIIYSKYKDKVVDSVDFGARMSMSSAFVRQPPRITQLDLEINKNCLLNCSFCGQTSTFECLSCSSDKGVPSISYKDAVEAIKHLSVFGIPMLLIRGGDPLIEFELTKKIIIYYKKLNPSGMAIILTNGTSLLSLSDEQLKFLSKWTRIFLVVVNENLENLSEIINIHERYNIQYDLISRNVGIGHNQLGDVTVNNTINIRQGIQQNIFTKQNIVRPYDLYNNTIKYTDPCYRGKIYMNANGDVAICKAYSEVYYTIRKYSWAYIMHELTKQWHNMKSNNLCGTCKINRLCYSCEFIKELYHNGEITDNICFSNII